MNIHLDLSRHCIETAIKRRHNKAISCYFKAPGQRELEEEIALLGSALEDFDFQRLRSNWPILAGHGDMPVALSHGPAGQPVLTFDNICLIPPANLA